MPHQYDHAKTDWFRDCRRGVFCHYLADPPSSEYGSAVTADAWNAGLTPSTSRGVVS